MINPFGAMYLRPGNLWKSFAVKRLRTEMVNGYAVDSYADTGIYVTGVLAEATANQSDMRKHLWDQDQHSLTHTLVAVGKVGLKKGDFLTVGERTFLVLLVDDVGALGIANLVYLEERNDVK
ncbi:MAG TPA: hypothetical protein IAA06_13155 [Candidatus Blautia faecavium]|uniref:Uncharacterized protein n=1 Tax=Candidatus Blautia faecavium TaxID=2838487 RepID=A0A9D2LUA8_9FIRM|nr:hypothetical protein [Candidatus Blautia faecavium]